MSELQNDSENQNEYSLSEETQSAEQIDADNVEKTTSAESSQQMNTDDNDEATPKEDASSAVPADQVEAVTKVFSELQSAVKNEDYEQAWMLFSEVLKSESNIDFEEFKKDMVDEGNEVANAIAHPDSTIKIEDRVGLLLTSPSNEDNEDGTYLFFIQEDGQWKICDIQRAEYVDTSKE